MAVQITRTDVEISLTPSQLARLRSDFAVRGCVLLPRLICPELLSFIQSQLATARFSAMVHEGIGTEYAIKEGVIPGALRFSMNRRPFLHFVEQVTGCDRIGTFAGRVYRMVPAEGHYDSWHDDIEDGIVTGIEDEWTPHGRLVALSLNLSDAAYEGGALLLRDKVTEQTLSEVRNIGLGDAIMFRLAQHLEHRVADVVGDVPKTAFAGWFHRRPEYESMYAHILRPSNSVTSSAVNPP